MGACGHVILRGTRPSALPECVPLQPQRRKFLVKKWRLTALGSTTDASERLAVLPAGRLWMTHAAKLETISMHNRHTVGCCRG